MKIAIVSMTPAFPALSGNCVRILQLCRALKALGHELTFIHVSSRLDRQRPDHGAHAAFFGPGRYLALDNGGRLSRGLFRLRYKSRDAVQKTRRKLGLDHGHYSSLDQHWRSAWSRQLRRLDGEFDLVIAEYVFNSRALDAFGAGTRKWIDTHDSFADRHRPFVAQGFDKGYWISLTPQAECTGFRRAGTVIAIQPEEARRFAEQLARQVQDGPAPRIAVVSHMLDATTPLADLGTDHAATYVGTNMLSNQISLREFLDHVLPRITAQLPGFRLKLVGSICRWAPDHPAVDKLGFVDELADAFACAPVSINPTLAGTGINIKLLDALRLGVPTVSTTTGVRGLPADYRNGVVVVPDHDHAAFADEIVRLCCNATLRGTLGQAAHADALRWNQAQMHALQRCLEDEATPLPTRA